MPASAKLFIQSNISTQQDSYKSVKPLNLIELPVASRDFFFPMPC